MGLSAGGEGGGAIHGRAYTKRNTVDNLRNICLKHASFNSDLVLKICEDQVSILVQLFDTTKDCRLILLRILKYFVVCYSLRTHC